jgi:hemoglobin
MQHNGFILSPVNDTNLQPSLYERMGGRDGLARLLRHFYADVRQHALIGPIFNQQIKDWPAHLEKIGSFWARLTGGPSGYSGQMPRKHLPLGLEAQHFGVWLQLWTFNCRSHLPEAEAGEMIGLAQEIGQRLKTILGVEPLSDDFLIRNEPFRPGKSSGV